VVLYTSTLESSHSIVRRHISSLRMYQKVLRVMTHRLQKKMSQMDENWLTCAHIYGKGVEGSQEKGLYMHEKVRWNRKVW
jgi:hypothetical protein